jgi:hypothetical protein
MKDDLSKIVEAIFTDEPSLMVCYLNTPREFKYAVIPWENSLPERFNEMHGYDLMPNLYALFEGVSDHEMHVRHHFHQTIGDMIASNYFGLISQWCEEHGIDSSGHLLLEERIIQHVAFSGDLMACLRRMQSPGVDMLTSKPERILKDGWFMAPKYAGSIAFLTNRTTVMSETSSHIETSGKISCTLQEMIGTANIQYLLGVNNMTSYYSWSNFYSDRGKEENQDTVYTKRNYAKYNEYIGRLGVMLKGAIHSADIALYYPIESIQAYFLPSTRSLDTGTQPLEAQHIQASLNDTALSLLYRDWDFDFLDARAVLDAQVADGALKFLNGQYKVVIMPSMKVIPADVLSRLQEFERQGGLLIWMGNLPDLGGSEVEDSIVLQKMQKYNSIEKLDILNEMLKRDLETEKKPAEAGVFIGHYVKEDMNIYYLVNVEPIDISMTVKLNKVNNVKIYDPFDGHIFDTTLPTNITISGYGGIFVIH